MYIHLYMQIYIHTYTYILDKILTWAGPGPGPRALAPGLPGHIRAARQPRGRARGPGAGPGPCEDFVKYICICMYEYVHI